MFLKNLKQVSKIEIKFLIKLKRLKKLNKKLIAIGASAKQVQCKLFQSNYKDVFFITDNSPHKIGKFIPNKKSQSKNEALKNISNANVFFSTWNISDFVKKKITTINKSIKLLNTKIILEE